MFFIGLNRASGFDRRGLVVVGAFASKSIDPRLWTWLIANYSSSILPVADSASDYM